MKCKAGPEDVKWLAKTWESLLERYEYPSRAFAMYIVYDLCAAYLRGAGLKMGSPKAFIKNRSDYINLVVAVIRHVIDEPVKDVWFPTLQSLGFTDLASANQIIDGVRMVLRERRE